MKNKPALNAVPVRMRPLAALLVFAASSGYALDAARLMSGLTWEKRVLLVFAPHEQDAGLRRQNAMLEAIGDGLIERDMIVIRAFADDRVSVDGEFHAQPASSFYRRFEVDPGEFRVILVGKDGGIKLDRNLAVSGDELFALIDSMPMRRYEMQQDG
jgi:hypothetical protein